MTPPDPDKAPARPGKGGKLTATLSPTRAPKSSKRRRKVSETTPRKGNHRTHGQMKKMLDAILAILAAEKDPITIRHLFYLLVSQGIIEKTEAAYKALCSHLSKWRRSGAVPWNSFTDSTRWHIQGTTFDNMQDALNTTVETYRRNLWADQDHYLEVWVEKDAIAGIVAPKANAFGVPVFVCRGFASLSSLFSAANTFRRMAEAGKKVIIYHFGDYDPSGVAAGQSVLKAMRDDFRVELQFIRAAVTEEQIEEMNLPTRPTKTTGTHARHWTGGRSVELDAMPAAELRRLVESCITRHIDVDAWNTLRRTEEMERETLRQMRDNFREAQP